jgi:hypothetical protein
MARTQNSPFPQFHSYVPHKDPWEIEHDALLERAPNAICHSDTIYTGLVHKGFNADSTAKELIRRYPPFQETERHREFLVRSISERYIIPGEKDDYFTPLQLWEEDDRVRGKKIFTRGGESSSSADESEDEASDLVNGQEVEPEPVVLKSMPRGRIGEDQLESDEQLALLLSDPVGDERTIESSEGPSMEQKSQDVEMTNIDLAELFGEEPEPELEMPAITITTPEAEDPVETGKDPELSIRLQSDDHTTTITHDYSDVQRLLASIDLSFAATLTAITHAAVDGSLVLAVFGHVKANNSAGSDLEHPIRLDDGVTGDSNTNKQRHKIEKLASEREWNTIAQRPHYSTLAFLSGPKTYNALLAEIRWDIDTIVATTTSYNDSRVLVLLVGEQQISKISRYAASAEQADPADQFDAFFASMRSHKSIPVEHAELASRLEVAHNDMIEAGALTAPFPEEGAADSLDGESNITAPLAAGRSTSDQIEALKKNTLRIEKQLNLAMKSAKGKKASIMRVADYSKDRMLQILQRPATEHIDLSKQNRVPIGAQSSQTQLPQQQVSGFPASFGKPSKTGSRVAAPKPRPAPSKKRARTPSDSDDEDGEDDTYTSQPQRKRKVAGRGRGRPRKNPVVPASATPGRRQANKAMTAAESLQSIAEVKARLAGFEDARSRSGKSSSLASPD